MSHDQPTKSTFRKVSTNTWTDKRVRALSPMQPSGQALFVMLLIGPQTTNIPGVQPVGRLAFAEMLEWEPEAFDEAFAEAFAQGLVKADWKARLVFVPKAIQHNLPQSPNVVKSWEFAWAHIPDCDLKREAWRTIYAALHEMGESFSEAFKNTCPIGEIDEKPSLDDTEIKPSDKACAKPYWKPTDNQRAERREQITDTTTGASPVVGSAQARATPATDPPVDNFSEPQGLATAGEIEPEKSAEAGEPERTAATAKPDKPPRVDRAKPVPKSGQGTRLPDDWQLPKSWGEWALGERTDLTEADVRREAACFADYWHAKAGADARKADWEATWRNWIRKGKEFRRRQNHNLPAARASPLRAGEPIALVREATMQAAEIAKQLIFQGNATEKHHEAV